MEAAAAAPEPRGRLSRLREILPQGIDPEVVEAFCDVVEAQAATAAGAPS
jgi:hypothetical protein